MGKNTEKIKKKGRPKTLSVGSTVFSKRLFGLIKERGITQEWIERAARLSNGSLSRMLETGSPTLQKAWDIEDALLVPRGYLCGAMINSENAPSAGANGANVTNPHLIAAEALVKTHAFVHDLFHQVLLERFSAEEFCRILLSTDKEIIQLFGAPQKVKNPCEIRIFHSIPLTMTRNSPH